MPNIMTQMLFRGANGVGYTTYPDNVVQAFVGQAASSGIDVFRVFDSLNWVENMRVAMDAVLETGKVLEASICYTGDLLDPERSKYDLKYYVGMARDLQNAGTHVLGLKDMAGLLKPAAARILVKALKEETGLPLHFHTHDTSGIAGSTVLAAAEAGADAVDAAMDAMSGGTSQPALGSIVEALRHTERDTGLDIAAIRRISDYWEAVRTQYAAFESGLMAPASEVYLHEMPGGQFTNLKAQARSMGLEDRWHEVAQTYAEVNRMFGDIIKVTPSSKTVGDMALMMVSQGLSRADVENPDVDVAFPDSVVGMMRGQLGQPPGGWPAALQAKVLKGDKPLEVRPGSVEPPADFPALEAKMKEEIGGGPADNEDFCGYLMYPKVFVEYRKRNRDYGPVRTLPTPVFFYGMEPGDEISVEIDPGKILEIRLQAVGETNEDGDARVFFELNGQPRTIRVPDRKVKASAPKRPKADPGDQGHVAAPMPGVIAGITVAEGQAREGRRSADDHRGDEDGDGSLRRKGRKGRRAACPYRRAGRRQGSAGRDRLRVAGAADRRRRPLPPVRARGARGSFWLGTRLLACADCSPGKLVSMKAGTGGHPGHGRRGVEPPLGGFARSTTPGDRVEDRCAAGSSIPFVGSKAHNPRRSDRASRSAGA